MTCSSSTTGIVWPGFQTDGGLLLPLPQSMVSSPQVDSLELDGQRFTPKLELHVTLLNRALGTTLRDALGVDVVRRHFEGQDWGIARTGEGHVLHKIKHDGMQTLVCGSIIERLQFPALARFRAALACAAQVAAPAMLPHVTLHVAGDPSGIGLPDIEAFKAARVADIRLPGIDIRAPSPLSQDLLATYQAAHYVIDDNDFRITLTAGERSSRMDALLKDYGSMRAILVTAYNPFSETTDPRANNLRQQMLRHALREAGLVTLDAEGRDPDGLWPPEPSLLVFGTTPVFEERLLRDYEQHAIVVVEQGEPVVLALHPDHRS